jgi:hypothetical protein
VTRRENGRNVPDVRFTAVTVGIGQKLRENVAKRVKNVVERPNGGKTETRRTKTDVRGPAARFTAVTVGIGQKRREIVAKRVETCEKRGRTAETEENGRT